MRRRLLWIALCVALLGGLAAALFGRELLGRMAVLYYSGAYTAQAADTTSQVLPPLETGTDSAAADTGAAAAAQPPQTPGIELLKVAAGFTQPVDLQFVPGKPRELVVVEKGGSAQWVDLAGERRRQWLSLPVRTDSEQGLLGLAFHPAFADNGRFYLSYVGGTGLVHESRISEWTHPTPGDLSEGTPRERRVILRQAQPYQNHNGGQIAFGPDGMLYIGFGDGGLAGDPKQAGQDRGSLLGAILRIDVDPPQHAAGHGDRAYGIPADNPFVGQAGAAPELWAIGLRNPWRFSFLGDGALVVADVGQDQWEEIDVVRAGDNLGWNVREGLSCYAGHARCGEAFVDPVHVYGRSVGISVTGGHVYTGSAIAGLSGHYVFADFVSGRFFALSLPTARTHTQLPPGGLPAQPLGRWPVLPSAFARDARGELYVAAFAHGIVYRLGPAAAQPATGPRTPATNAGVADAGLADAAQPTQPAPPPRAPN